MSVGAYVKITNVGELRRFLADLDEHTAVVVRAESGDYGTPEVAVVKLEGPDDRDGEYWNPVHPLVEGVDVLVLK